VQICVLRSNVHSFGNILDISGIKQIDQFKVECLLQVLWSLVTTVIFYSLLLQYTKQNLLKIVDESDIAIIK